MKIPVVDFSSWNNPRDKSDRMRVAQELVEACQRVGFVYIVNHSLPEAVLDEAFAWTKRLFDLPQEVKMKAPHPPGWALHRGYSPPGFEKVSQNISTGDDEETKRKMREIPDVKVGVDVRCIEQPQFDLHRTDSQDCRKSMISAATRIPYSPTSGSLRSCFPASEPS